MFRLAALAICLSACAFDPFGPAGERREDAETPDAGADSSDAGNCAGGQRAVSDTFRQASGLPLDLLLVVDDSGSMQPLQDALAKAMPDLTGELDRLGVDFRAGVVTTDMDGSNQRAGMLRSVANGPRWVTPGAAAAGQLKEIVASIGVFGSGTEQGLLAMKAALSEPLASDPEKNLGFRRPATPLAVVVLSDEDDASPDTAGSYASFLDGSVGAEPAATELDVLVGDVPGGCYVLEQQAQAGTRYLDAQRASGGLAGSICSLPYGPWLVNVARRASRAKTSFALTRPARGKPTEVTVDGVTSPPAGWRFEGGAVVFDVPPAGGADVVVRYSIDCD